MIAHRPSVASTRSWTQASRHSVATSAQGDGCWRGKQPAGRVPLSPYRRLSRFGTPGQVDTAAMEADSRKASLSAPTITIARSISGSRGASSVMESAARAITAAAPRWASTTAARSASRAGFHRAPSRPASATKLELPRHKHFVVAVQRELRVVRQGFSEGF